MSRGYIYVLTNPSMPGLVKIGMSKYSGSARAAQLRSTGVPEQFKLEFEILVDDARSLESDVHSCLVDKRVSDKREFFKCETIEAIESILNEYACTFDRAICSADERFIIDGVLMAARKTKHHFMTALYSLQNIAPSDIDRLVLKSKTGLKVVK